MRSRTLIFILFFAIFIGAIAYILIQFYISKDFPGMGYGFGLQLYHWMPLIIVPATLIIVLLTYLILFPEIEQKPSFRRMVPKEQQSHAAVVRVLKDDEKKVVELLLNTGGTMLQSEISKKTGFTRVKTHRILYRLSTRGIVSAKKYYNTYQITLADWLL